MWTGTVVLFMAFSLTPGVNSQLYDVTTIYQVDSLDTTKTSIQDIKRVVHARTNALGMQLSDGPTIFDSYPAVLSNITCDISAACDWDVKGGSRTQQGNLQENLAYPVYGTVGLNFTRFPDPFTFYCILFSSTSALVRESSQYYRVKVDSKAIGLVKCDPTLSNNYGHTDRDGTYFYTGCYTIQSIQVTSPYFWFRFTNSRVEIWSDERQTNKIFDWIDNDFENMPPVEVQSFSIFSDPSGRVEQYGPSFINKKGFLGSDGSVTSPLFIPTGRTLCLALLFSAEVVSDSATLMVYVEDLQKQHLLKVLKPKIGYTHKVLNERLPEDTKGLVRILIKNNGSDTLFHRIATCNPDGADVTYLDAVPSSSLTQRTVFVIDQYQQLFPNGETNKTSNFECQNGGKATPAGCACPAGFIGQDCEQGCGRNSFGLDCGGICSAHSGECQGLLLCMPDAGCRCAPGYRGAQCTTKCPLGQYGADCSEICGHCFPGTSCDIYSGECSMCAPGYLPPYCKKVYMYYASKPEVSSQDYGKVNVSFNLRNVKGYGSPKLYQIQYMKPGEDWTIYTTKVIPSNMTNVETPVGFEEELVTEQIDGLENGSQYLIRVLLMDSNFNKYTGDLVQYSGITTKCDIPKEHDYNIVTHIETTSISFSWNYEPENIHWCSLKSYQVVWKENWEDALSEVTDHNVTLSDLIPGSEVQFKVRALTSGGYAPYSETVRVSTPYKESKPVRNLRSVTTEGTAAKISWQPPRGSENRKLHYKITYKCLERLACSPGCHNASEGKVTHEDTILTIKPLLPFSQYLVTVSAEEGPGTSIYIGTSEVGPTETPSQSDQMPLRTNTSLTVFWDQGPVCSSFLLGYNYQLIKESESLEVLASGFTTNTSVSFHNLTADTDYMVRVFVVTVAGHSQDNYLTINTSTSATVPEAVRNLTVYKQSRSMLGLRWTEPRATYGQLKSFTVKYVVGKDKRSHTIEPTHCPAWPQFFCHTIVSLKPNHTYNISISARNMEVADDGVETIVPGTTKETAPSAPVQLTLVKSTSTSVVVQWDHPDLANGLIRSFIVNVEEIEKFNQDSCCQGYPLIETPFREEKETYEAEVSGLQPASTYSVSVSARTVALGPSQSLLVYTQPPQLPVSDLPRVNAISDEWYWFLQEGLTEMNDTVDFSALIKCRLLLLVPEASQESSDTGISDSQLDSLLKSLIKKPFYFISDYNKDDMDVSEDMEERESMWGRVTYHLHLSQGQRYQLAAAQVTQYSGSYNADLVYSSIFTHL